MCVHTHAANRGKVQQLFCLASRYLVAGFFTCTIFSNNFAITTSRQNQNVYVNKSKTKETSCKTTPSQLFFYTIYLSEDSVGVESGEEAR